MYIMLFIIILVLNISTTHACYDNGLCLQSVFFWHVLLNIVVLIKQLNKFAATDSLF